MNDLAAVSKKTHGNPFLKGGGEMGELTRNFDWSATSLGNPDQWPISLSTTVSNLLHSKFPMFLWWGEDFIQFYNDAYRPSLGASGKHPTALGQKGVDCWPEIWEIIYPLIQQVQNTGEGTWREDQLIPIFRNGKIEDVYWTFSYGAVLDDEGRQAGILVTCVETTEKIKKLKQIEEGKNELKFAVDAAELATIDLNPVTNRFNGSDRLKDWFGLSSYTSIDLVLLLSAVLEKDRQRVASAIERALDFSSGGYFDIEFAIVNENTGGSRIIRAKGKAWFNAENVAYRFNGVLQDVTLQSSSLAKSQESEARLRAVIAAAPAGIGLFVGRDLIVEMPNQTFIDIVGKGDDIEGKPLREVMPELETENQPFLKILDDVYTTGKMFQSFASQVNIVQNGVMTHKFYNITYTPIFDTEGKVYAILDIAIDVTEQVVAKKKVEENERNLRNTILQAPVAMCIFKGPAFTVEIANDRMLEFWGKNRAEVLNKSIWEGLPEAKNQGFEELLTNVYTTGEAFSALGLPIILPRNGSLDTVYVNFAYEAFREPDDSISGIMAVAVDVTEQVLARHKIEEVVAQRTSELALANSLLQQSNIELNQFAYIASHDLQEPLRKVRTFVSLMESGLGEVPEKVAGYMKRIQSATERMQALINDILTFSKLSKERERFGNVELNCVLQTALDDFDLLIDQKKAVIKAANLPAIEAIPLQMNQLFSNIISNALKFNDMERQLQITITSEQLLEEEFKNYPELERDKAYHKIQFVDNGIGFEQEHAEKIFTIFQRLHGKTEYEGTGIGLAMCKKIVQNHHGIIYAHSDITKGSTFTIILPQIQYKLT